MEQENNTLLQSAKILSSKLADVPELAREWAITLFLATDLYLQGKELTRNQRYAIEMTPEAWNAYRGIASPKAPRKTPLMACLLQHRKTLADIGRVLRARHALEERDDELNKSYSKLQTMLANV